jgi:hypothetical protein
MQWIQTTELFIVRLYFKLGFSQKEMLYSLAAKHRTILSLRHLKRIRRQLALYRSIHSTSVMEVAMFIVEKLHISGALHGYRWMHSRCLENDLVVSKHTVRHLLGILDPNGVQMEAVVHDVGCPRRVRADRGTEN